MKKIILLSILPLVLLACNKQQAENINWQQKLKQASELGTVQYTVEKVISADDDSFSAFGNRKILFSFKAVIKAGVDMAKFNANNCVITEDKEHRKSINVVLPSPEILTYNINPDDIKLLYSEITGFRHEFTSKERDEILTKGELDLKQDKELERVILRDAEQNARTFFEMLLKQSDFSNVSVSFNQSNTENQE